MHKLILIIISGMLLSACGAARYVVVESEEPSEENCTIYVFRDDFTLLWSNYVEIDGKSYAKLADNTYTFFNVDKGEHQMALSWAPGSGGVPLENIDVPCPGGKTGYFAYEGYYLAPKRYIRGKYISKNDAESRLQNYQLAE